ncbi:unnamed protein product [Menidia menidia]
MPEKA